MYWLPHCDTPIEFVGVVIGLAPPIVCVASVAVLTPMMLPSSRNTRQYLVSPRLAKAKYSIVRPTPPPMWTPPAEEPQPEAVASAPPHDQIYDEINRVSVEAIREAFADVPADEIIYGYVLIGHGAPDTPSASLSREGLTRAQRVRRLAR